MRSAACLHADKTRRQLGKERQHLRSPQRLANDRLSGGIDRVNLKNALGQIEADRANLHRGWLPLLVDAATASTLWHSDAGSGSHPPHLQTTVDSGDRRNTLPLTRGEVDDEQETT